MSKSAATTAERLVEAAASLLDKGGEAAVTLRAVAQAVGVSHNAPYRHFTDRSALLAAVAERDLRRFTDDFEGIAQSERPPIEKVKAVLAAFTAYGKAYPARYRLLFSDPAIASRGGTLESVAMTTFTTFGRIVQAAQDADDLPPVPTPTLTGLIFATMHGLLDFKTGGRMRAEKGFSDVLDGVELMLELIGKK